MVRLIVIANIEIPLWFASTPWGRVQVVVFWCLVSLFRQSGAFVRHPIARSPITFGSASLRPVNAKLSVHQNIGLSPNRRAQEVQDSHRKRTAQRNSHYFASAATCIWTILSGLGGGSPFFSLSTTSMPCTTSPITVYLPFRNGPSANMMKN